MELSGKHSERMRLNIIQRLFSMMDRMIFSQCIGEIEDRFASTLPPHGPLIFYFLFFP